MSEYSPENPDSVFTPDDAGHMQTTDIVPNAQDGATPTAGFDLSLHMAIGSLGHKIDKLNYDMACREQARLQSEPNLLALPAKSAALPALNTGVLLDFGTPQAGRQWDIRSLVSVISGIDLNDTVQTMFVSWYVGVPPPPPIAATSAQITSSQLKWNQSNAIGLQADKVGPGIIPVRPNEHLFAIAVTATAGTVGLIINCSATVADMPVKAAAPIVATS